MSKLPWNDGTYVDSVVRAKEAAVDFRKLEAFLTVANTGKFVTAAEKLFISQSSLSKQMSQLERELGVKLFKKTRNGVELTQAGHDFYSYARKAVPDYQHEVSRLKMYKQNATYTLTVGALPLCEEYGFADSFSSYWVRNTSVQIQFVERNQDDLLDKLKRHKVEIALARTDFIDESWFSFKPIVEDQLVLVCSTSSRWARHKTVSLCDLKDEQFILLEGQSECTRMFLRACETYGFHPNVPLNHSRHRMLLKAVQRRMGVSVMSSKLVSTYNADDIASVPFEQPIISTIGFIWLRDEQPSKIAQGFMDFVCRDFANKHLENAE
ncbi:LysR family transcriptional regulator [Collinsella sp. An2]|uniref:LysR family transcriptional regulator n=1 Tax=Collinsella sp. An2 TaxID=1965585 RepID=UPI000B39ADC5|nr:LysR family transcriptional regulator [Collinsella sp. An2]OUP10527.1 hypothetical protein B5F33_02915 [Collinsella sp. An2]